jgi:hypothetical protein
MNGFKWDGELEINLSIDMYQSEKVFMLFYFNKALRIEQNIALSSSADELTIINYFQAKTWMLLFELKSQK